MLFPLALAHAYSFMTVENAKLKSPQIFNSMECSVNNLPGTRADPASEREEVQPPGEFIHRFGRGETALFDNQPEMTLEKVPVFTSFAVLALARVLAAHLQLWKYNSSLLKREAYSCTPGSRSI